MYIFKIFLFLWFGIAVAADNIDIVSEETENDDLIIESTVGEMDRLYDVLVDSFQSVDCRHRVLYRKSEYYHYTARVNKFNRNIVINTALFHKLQEIYENGKESPESLKADFTQAIREAMSVREGIVPAMRRIVRNTVQHFFETVSSLMLSHPISCYK